MTRLTIFDDDEKIATITSISGLIFILARSPREYNDMNRLIHFDYKVKMEHDSFLKHVAERAATFNYSTELIN